MTAPKSVIPRVGASLAPLGWRASEIERALAGASCAWRGLLNAVLVGAMLLLVSGVASAQEWARCESGGEFELDHSIRNHHEQMFRMMDKFKNYWYLQGALPKTFQGFSLADLKLALRTRPDLQKSGVLFYTYSARAEQLCVWVIRGTGEVERAIRIVRPSDFDSIRPRLLAALGAQPPGSIRDRQEIKRISEDLVPPSIVRATQAWGVTRLLVVPIFDLGEIPYAALEMGDGRMLMDVAKVIIVPGFFVFTEPARLPSGRLEDSVVAVHEGGSGSVPGSGHPLQFALASGVAVKASLGVKEPVLNRLRDATKRLESDTAPRFVFIAAHGISNTNDPVDGGKVEMADGPWNGREVTRLREKGGLKGHPIVILSACESGTGKMFDVGSIGLSRAWYYAGASSVVASLWRVDERATMELMNVFVENAKTMPVDDALWTAMKSLRDQGKGNVDPMYWAAFSIFGGPPVR
jgi:hypothetical protein